MSSLGSCESSFLDLPERLRHEKSCKYLAAESPSASHVRPDSSIGQRMDETCFRPSVTIPLDLNSSLSRGPEPEVNETSIWTEDFPQDGSSSCLLNYGMCNQTAASNSLQQSPTTEDIIKHVENLPSDIDTPPMNHPHDTTYLRQNTTVVALCPEQLEGPPTPVLMRSLGTYPTMLLPEASSTTPPTLTKAAMNAGMSITLQVD